MIRALVVGINKYSNFPDQSLSGCLNDADDVILSVLPLAYEVIRHRRATRS